jgi:hypothetical protein
MSLESFHRFLNRACRGFASWVRGGDSLPARLARWTPAGLRARLPGLGGFLPGEAQVAVHVPPGAVYLELSYRFRSLDCQVQVGLQETSPGMQRINQALLGPKEA